MTVAECRVPLVMARAKKGEAIRCQLRGPELEVLPVHNVLDARILEKSFLNQESE
jgi:hypothetical protein